MGINMNMANWLQERLQYTNQIVKLKKWIEKHKKKGVVVFVDVRKAFDSIEREEAYNQLRKCGINENGVQWYKRLTQNIYLKIGEEIIDYQRGYRKGQH